MTTTTQHPDQDTRVVVDVDLDKEVPCALRVVGDQRCGRPATWRIYWRRLSCGHRQPPTLTCDRCRQLLAIPGVCAHCGTCGGCNRAVDYIRQVEAL